MNSRELSIKDSYLNEILSILQDVILHTDERILEVGSGNGHQAIFFAKAFPRMEWYPTDLSPQMPIMEKNFKEANLHNIRKSQRLDVSKDDFPKLRFDVVYTSNTFHVMHWKDCKSFMKLLGHRLRENSRAIIYGPFKYNGEFLTEEHKKLDQELKLQDPLSGIRPFEDVQSNMEKNGFELIEDHEMGDKNRLLVYNRLKFVSQNKRK
jgi:cyclopropane fatty-acyl-phospholipid synthase-like methyltransferase